MTYAGDVTVQDAWSAIADEADAVLIDVRTQAEWMFVGVPDLSPLGKTVQFIEWQSLGGPGRNLEFEEQLQDTNGAAFGGAAYFLCRSGARSRDAAVAMTQAGWERCFNVADGFEGPPDSDRHRGKVAGWKVAGLPWLQG